MTFPLKYPKNRLKRRYSKGSKNNKPLTKSQGKSSSPGHAFNQPKHKLKK